MKVLDTTYLIDLLRADKKVLELFKNEAELLTTQINMYEVISGLFLRKISYSKFSEILSLFEHIRVIPFDDDAVIHSARIYSELTKRGKKIPDTDCMIAGSALGRGIDTIITRDIKDFRKITEMNIETY